MPVLRLDGSRKLLRGFTLIEVIVVIFIIALASSVIMLRLGVLTPSRGAERLSKQLYAYFNVVREQAIIEPAVLGVVISGEGYTVVAMHQADPPSWVPMIRHARLWQPTSISPDIQMSLVVDGAVVKIPPRLSKVKAPQIYFMPGGEISPFDLFIQQNKQKIMYHLQGNFAGEITLEKMSIKHGR